MKRKKREANNFSLFTFHFSLFVVPLHRFSYDIAKKHRGVAQLVAHLVWDQVVARSSRVTPTFFVSVGLLAPYFLFPKILSK